MILERIYEVAKPRLAGRRVIDIRIGLHLMAVELDSGLDRRNLCVEERNWGIIVRLFLKQQIL
jgi:hypothetical protein